MHTQNTKTTTNKTLTRELFPRQLTTTALEEIGAQIITRDSSYDTKTTNTTNLLCSIIVILPP